MKRFIIVMVSLIFMITIGLYLYFVEGFYFTFKNDHSITTSFYVKGDEIYQYLGEGDESFQIKGVEIDSSYGPKRGTDFTIDAEKWNEWFGLIQEMGANTIKTMNVLDDDFYNAFYEYNINNEQPLYLLQGMQVTTFDMILNPSKKESQDFYKILKKDGKDLVDIIHGQKVLFTNKHKGNGYYFKDISPWVIGYLIGEEWNQDSIAYINETLEHRPEFNGKYVTTSSEATNFQKMMARLMEQIMGYESRKYQEQRLVSVNSNFMMDPFHYEEHYAAQIGKFNHFMIENIHPTDKMESGIFASYAYEDLELPMLEMMENKETFPYPEVTDYLELLYQKHEIPVVITSIGYPGEAYLNQEHRQGDVLLNGLQKFDSIGYNGAIIRSWQDVWDRRVLETSYAVDLQQINEWHDIVTPTQHFGLLGFKPYRDQVLMTVDGKDDDWQDVSEKFRNEETEVLMTRDHAYVYFWIENSQITKHDTQYLALDLHPNLGSKTPSIVGIPFDRKVDFLIEINPHEGANVYVQNRYQSVRQNFLEDVTGENPFEIFPRKNSHSFELVQYLKEEKSVLTEEEMDDLATEHYRYIFKEMYPLALTGGHPLEEADIALGDGYLEIRLPYQLLNVYDPLKFTIHDDYYEHYGVEPLEIDNLYMGVVTNDEKEIESIKIPIEPLESLSSVEEFLKPSYDRVKKYWSEGD